MLPRVLRPEALSFISVTVVPATADRPAHLGVTLTPLAPAPLALVPDLAPPDCRWCDGYDYDGHAAVCPGRLENQDDQDEEPGSRCSKACGYCGRCS